MDSTHFVGIDAHKDPIVVMVVNREANELDPTWLGSGAFELEVYLNGSWRTEAIAAMSGWWLSLSPPTTL